MFVIGEFCVYSSDAEVTLMADGVEHVLSGQKIDGCISAGMSAEDAILLGTALVEAGRAKLAGQSTMSPARSALEKYRAITSVSAARAASKASKAGNA